MTEDEAKKKWCPMVRAGDVNTYGCATLAGAWNSYMQKVDVDKYKLIRNPKEARCLASKCMMWREYVADLELYGYCGLAGKP